MTSTEPKYTLFAYVFADIAGNPDLPLDQSFRAMIERGIGFLPATAAST
tara:strand:- start:6773 stop:6919 length:147 start_codon:yes stop_codon:yes gene_type:complete